VTAVGSKGFLLVAALTFLSLCTPVIAQDQSILQAVLNDPAVQQHALDAAKQSAVIVNNPCPAARYALTGKGAVYTALERDPSGVITKGAFKLEVHEDGCGASHTLNVLGVVQTPGKLGLAPLLPGATLAGPQLQKDAINSAATSAGGPEKDCKIGYIEDTEFVKQDSAPVQGASAAPWRELWTLVTCTRRAHVPMRFIPQRNGTQIVAETAKIDPIQAKK
jgi:hypothetical protein